MGRLVVKTLAMYSALKACSSSYRAPRNSMRSGRDMGRQLSVAMQVGICMFDLTPFS